jgi:hypothetical protein
MEPPLTGLYSLAEVLGSAEGDLLAGLDLQRLARRRVAAHASRALADLKGAKAGDTDFRALLQVLADERDGRGKNAVRLLLGQALGLADRNGELTERDKLRYGRLRGLGGGFRGRSRLGLRGCWFDCHFIFSLSVCPGGPGNCSRDRTIRCAS